MSEKLVPGNRVKFNLGKANGPLYYGLVTKVSPEGGVLIKPDRAGYIGPGIKFFNIKKVGPATK